MNIQSMASSSGTGGGSGGTGKSAAAAGAFQGVLVQTIGTGVQSGDAGKGTAGPMLGLLGMLNAALTAVPDAGESATAEAGDEQALAQLLDGLEAQLGQLQDADDLPQSALDRLAELLASLQSLLNPQQTLPEDGAAAKTGADGAGGVAAAGSGAAGFAQGAGAVVPALLDAVKQLRGMMQGGQLTQADVAAASANIRSLTAGLQANEAAPATELKKPGRTPARADEPVAATGTPSEGVQQTDAKKTYPVFKEPVVYWNLQATDSAENGAAAVQEPAADQADAADVQTGVWSPAAADIAAKSDGSPAKPTLPAQVPVQQFAEQMDKFMVKQFTLSGAGGISEANINLHPEHLGEVQIRITIAHGQMSAQFIAHSEAAKDLLESQMSQLRGSLQSQGIQVERVEVVQQPQQTADGSSLFQQEQRRQQFAGNGESGRSAGGAETLETFEEELERTESLRNAGFGGSLNVTA